MSDRQPRDGTIVLADRQRTDSSVTMLFEVLASPYRRFILEHLSPQEEVSVDDLAQQLATWEVYRAKADKTDEAYRRIQHVLFHIHLPKLEDDGLVEYDHERGTVTLREAEILNAAEPYLNFSEHQ
jgi:DNA-binding transcriptional ArsR family regulator